MRDFVSCLPGPGRLVPAGLAIVLLTAAGCGGKFTPVPVSGVVTLDGQPIEGATVYFYAVGDEKDGRPAHGTTDKEGKFKLSTLGDEDGALRRNYKVVITKYVPTIPNLKIPDFPDTLEGRNDRSDFMYRNFEAKGIQPFRNALPPIYGDSNTTPLSSNITESTTLKFELKSN
jgi:Domain of unknown function (DUF6795)